MTESSESSTETVPTPVPAAAKPNRLYQAAAWVAIVAGSLFIVAVIFCTGLALGGHSGGGHFNRHGEHSMMDREGGPSGCPMMQRGHGMMPGGPGMMPGMMPGGPGGPGMTPSPAPQTPPTR